MWADDELIRAVGAGDLVRVDALIGAGAGPEATNPHGVPALVLAAIRGEPEIVRRLIRAGADPDRRYGDGGMAALMVAGSQVGCMRALIEGGADVNVRGADGMNAILSVLYDGDASLDAARVLLEAGADPTVPEHVSGQCALDITAPADRALFVELGFDPDERPEPRLDHDTLWEVARAEATRLGWEVPADPVTNETRYTICFEIRSEPPGGWTDDEFARWLAADPADRDAIGLAVRDGRQRQAIRLDVSTGDVLTLW